jgi:AraC family transcriptional regulator
LENHVPSDRCSLDAPGTGTLTGSQPNELERYPRAGERVARPLGGLSPKLERLVCAYIDAHLSESFRCYNLARVAGLSQNYFSRAFRVSFGVCAMRYVHDRRIALSQTLMLADDAPLSEIALGCGMADQAHFSRLFRRIVGQSPSAWRRSMRITAASAARADRPHAG